MSGKGDDRRPLSVDEKTFSDNWDRIFNGARLGADTASNTANVGSIPTAPATHDASWDRAFPGHTVLVTDDAIYINADTGEQVTEDWWPTIAEPTNRS